VAIRTAIVDDEPLARSNLSLLLRLDPEIEIVSECGSGLDAPNEIRRAKPDLLFLDVQMPEYDGFDVLELLGKDVPPALVFVTAYDQYALRAFDAGALDYLLKPFDNARFERTVARAKQKIARDKMEPQRPQFLTVKSAAQVTFIKLPEIDWIEAADYYAALHVGEKVHLLRRSISELEQDLDPAWFCRIHRSFIVNLDRVRGLKPNQEGEYVVLLEGGVGLRLSRRYRKQLQSCLAERVLRPPHS
jgi:two-component system, LytTR family, response regulator